MTPPDPYTCSEALRRLDDFVDRELSPAEQAALSAHLATCATCAREFRFEASVIRHLRSKVARIAMPAGLEARVWQAVVRAQRGREKSGHTSGGGS
jgi:anti-sigma factor (TIGR02949 family)